MDVVIVWSLVVIMAIYTYRRAYKNIVLQDKIALAKRQLDLMEAELDAAERERRPFRWPFPPHELVQLPNPA
jgi:hypothetical protein